MHRPGMTARRTAAATALCCALIAAGAAQARAGGTPHGNNARRHAHTVAAGRPAARGRVQGHDRQPQPAGPDQGRPDRRRDPVRVEHRLAVAAAGAHRQAAAGGAQRRPAATVDHHRPGGRPGQADPLGAAGPLRTAAGSAADREVPHRRIPDGGGVACGRRQHRPGTGRGRAHRAFRLHRAAAASVLDQPLHRRHACGGVRERARGPQGMADPEALPGPRPRDRVHRRRAGAHHRHRPAAGAGVATLQGRVPPKPRPDGDAVHRRLPGSGQARGGLVAGGHQGHPAKAARDSRVSPSPTRWTRPRTSATRPIPRWR